MTAEIQAPTPPGGDRPSSRGRGGGPRSRRTGGPADGPEAAAALPGEDSGALPPQPEAPAAPATPANPWAPTRRFEIGPDGRVRYLDGGPAPGQPAQPPTAEPALEADEASVVSIAEEDVAVTLTAEASAPARGRSRRGPRAVRAPEAPAAPSDDEQSSFISADATETVEVETTAELDDVIVEGEGGGEGETEAQRRRRRSRRGGRGRRRNGATPEGAVAGGEALAPELAQEEGVALPEAPQQAPSAPRVLDRAPRERSTPALSPLEQLTARQNVILDQLLQRQERMARSIEQAIHALDDRFRGSDLSHVASMPRVAVFVDVPNIMYAAERYRVQVDFGKLLRFVSRDRTLIRASAYAPISDDPSQPLSTQRFVEPFVQHGYRIVTKALKRFADGSIKANFDVELAMDILTMSDRLDIVSLVSGDGDFRRLVDIVGSKGVRVEVVSFRQSTSADLIAVADSYVDLTQHLKDLCVPDERDFKPRVARPKVDISGYTEGARIE